MSTKQFMIDEVNRFLNKLITGGVGGGSKFAYKTGTVAANGNITLDLATELAFNATTHYVASLGVELRMNDPASGAPAGNVIPAASVLSFVIDADGKLLIRNNTTNTITYHARITTPVQK